MAKAEMACWEPGHCREPRNRRPAETAKRRWQGKTGCRAEPRDCWGDPLGGALGPRLTSCLKYQRWGTSGWEGENSDLTPAERSGLITDVQKMGKQRELRVVTPPGLLAVLRIISIQMWAGPGETGNPVPGVVETCGQEVGQKTQQMDRGVRRPGFHRGTPCSCDVW